MEGKKHRPHSRSKPHAERHVGPHPSGVTLSADERDLVMLRDELYAGSWDDMLADLKNRMSGKPYIYKLVSRIQQDVNAIERLREMEKKHGFNLKEIAGE